MDCQERGLRESDWDDPIDSREEGSQKYASKSSEGVKNSRIVETGGGSTVVSSSTSSSSGNSNNKKVVISTAEVTAVVDAPVKKGSNAKVFLVSNLACFWHDIAVEIVYHYL